VIRGIPGPWGILGYSQGCANALMAESLLRGGTPDEQALLQGLRCRNLLFSALNGSSHGTAGDRKFIQAMVDLDHFLAHYQAVLSQRAIGLGLRAIGRVLDAPPVLWGMGGMRSLSRWGVLPLNQGGQFRDDVPTSLVRGVVEPETLPEALEFLSNVLTRQIESPLHDTQVAAAEAVGHPIWVRNAAAEVLRACDTGAMVQRTHHWSPLHREVEFVTTERDRRYAIYDAPKDRHVVPWIEVNARFGVIDCG